MPARFISMLYELFTSLTTSCPACVRDMNYLYEAMAMRGRHQRNREAWQPHLDNTRAFVLSAAERCANRSAVAVYGAGLLLDAPLEELAAMFQRVYLIDIVFLPDARRQARQFGNVTLVLHDAAHVAEPLYRSVRQGSSDLPEPCATPPDGVHPVGLVVSLNLLSQLWVMPRAYALSHSRNPDEERLDDWCGRIVQAHYGFLRSLGSQICLVADHTYVKRDREGTVVNRGSTVYGLGLPDPDALWTWNIAPLGELNKHVSKELLVGAWHF